MISERVKKYQDASRGAIALLREKYRSEYQDIYYVELSVAHNDNPDFTNRQVISRAITYAIKKLKHNHYAEYRQEYLRLRG